MNRKLISKQSSQYGVISDSNTQTLKLMESPTDHFKGLYYGRGMMRAMEKGKKKIRAEKILT